MEHHDCEVCKTHVGVTYRIDPYQEDVNNIIEYRWLCDECTYDIAQDI